MSQWDRGSELMGSWCMTDLPLRGSPNSWIWPVASIIWSPLIAERQFPAGFCSHIRVRRGEQSDYYGLGEPRCIKQASNFLERLSLEKRKGFVTQVCLTGRMGSCWKMCCHSWQAAHPSSACCFTYCVCMSLEAAWPRAWQGPQSWAEREIHTEGETMSHYAAC